MRFWGSWVLGVLLFFVGAGGGGIPGGVPLTVVRANATWKGGGVLKGALLQVPSGFPGRKGIQVFLEVDFEGEPFPE